MSEQAQEQQQEQEQLRLPIYVSQVMLDIIIAGLNELPMKNSGPVVQDIQHQIEEMSKKAAEQAKQAENTESETVE